MAFPELLDTDHQGKRWAWLDALAHRAADPDDPTTVTYEQFLEWADDEAGGFGP